MEEETGVGFGHHRVSALAKPLAEMIFAMNMIMATFVIVVMMAII
jgi:hypothetical protein